MAQAKINLDKHIWEGWRVMDFINELQPTLDAMYVNHRSWHYGDGEQFMTKQELRDWCKDNQPYYKKRIPEVSNYFIQRYGLKK